MKNTYTLTILVLLLFTNCEKVVDIDVPSIEPKLVIDATFEVNFDENPVTANTVVKLRLSADYFDETIPTVSNAAVFLTNLSDNSIINFFDANANGNYKPDSSFIPEDNIAYELTIIHENETYKGTATKIKSTPIIDVVQGDKTLFSGEEIELQISFSDDIVTENFYIFNIDIFNFITLEDRFFNGTDYNFSYFYEDENIEFPKNIDIKFSGITKEYFNYFRILQNQSGESGGGPFQSAPSSLLGNMINTTNDANFPLGYFHISETDTFNIDLIENN